MAAPYQNYTYDIDGWPNAEPQAYIPDQVITGRSLGLSDFNNPGDIFVAKSGDIYISDTGNNRIIVTDKNYAVKKIITTFDNQGKQDSITAQTGIFVTDDGYLYIADTGNQRIVVLNSQDKLYKVIGQPSSNVLAANYVYKPIKVAVDFAQRVYVVSVNCDQGVIEFDSDGSFLGYYGAIQTQTNAFQTFWRNIATKKQKASMSLIIPTEYSSIDIDSAGFVYGTVSAIDTSANFSGNLFIHKLNPMGTDVLKRYGFWPPMGDVDYATDKDTKQLKVSKLCDIAVQPYGIYSAIDSYKGRVFTYDDNGDLLFIFGGLGSKRGLFGNPVAIAATPDSRFMVVDNKYNQIVTFKPTEYGTLIMNAEVNNYKREYKTAENQWFQLLKYTSKSELVFDKIGQSYISEGQYKQAMKYLKLANDKSSYSEAFQYYRVEVMNRYFGPAMTAIIVIIVLLIVWHFVKKYKKPGRKQG